MFRTEVIHPWSATSPSPTSCVKVLLGAMTGSLRFAPQEWKRVATGVSVLLKRPSVLCISGTNDRVRNLLLTGKGSVFTRFHVLDSTHGVKNAHVHVRNLSRREIRTPEGPNKINFALFALMLRRVRVPLDVQHVLDHIRGAGAAGVSASRTLTNARVLKVSTEELRWITGTQGLTRVEKPSVDIRGGPTSLRVTFAEDTVVPRRTTIAFQVPQSLDAERITALLVRSISDPRVSVATARMHVATRTMYLQLRHPDGKNMPVAVTIHLTISMKQHKALMRVGEDQVLERLPVNGFLVRHPHGLQMIKDREWAIESDATYSSTSQIAIFLPYDVTGLDLPVKVWTPGSKLSISGSTTDDVVLSPGTPLGEIRFFRRKDAYVSRRKGTMSAPQSMVSTWGPEWRWRMRSTTVSRLAEDNSDSQETPPVSLVEAQITTFHERRRLNQREPGTLPAFPAPIPDDEGRELLAQRQYYRYNLNRSLPPPTPESMIMYEVAYDSRNTMLEELDRSEHGSESQHLRVVLRPLDLSFSSAALCAFLFAIPATAFNRTASSFYFTFSMQDRQLLKFKGLKGTEIYSSVKAKRRQNSNGGAGAGEVSSPSSSEHAATASRR